ncbi:carbohydrate ABC transporter permease [Actinoplanes sp. NPDC051861]|uniref:carbohydrate ABC transporter permease n=1 Tax=Actinoplanes sp. NPDC051861 TaxID=3155170 RepID=UPI0034183401
MTLLARNAAPASALPRPAGHRQRKPPSASRLWRVGVYLALVAAALFFLLPMYVLVVTSLKPFSQVSLATMWELPSAVSFDSFARAWTGDPSKGVSGLGANVWNSILMAIPATVLSAGIGSINGYVFAKWRFRGSNTLFVLFVGGLFVPYLSVLIPMVTVLRSLHLYGTIPGLIFVHVVYGLPICTLIFRNLYSTIPNELVETAKIDGAGILRIYTRVLLPLSIGAFAVTFIWQFTAIWNDFLFGIVVTSQPKVQPVTVALNNLAGSYVVEWNVQMAGALIAALPTLVIYLFLGRYFVRGLLAGSVKG